MFQTPLEELPKDLVVSHGKLQVIGSSSRQVLSRADLGETLVLEIADILDQRYGLIEKATHDNDDSGRLGITLNQISTNPFPSNRTNSNKKEGKKELPKRFIIDPAAIAVIEKITGKINDFDIPYSNIPNNEEEELNSNTDAEKSVIKSNSIKKEKKKVIPAISVTSNLLKGTKSTVAKSKESLEVNIVKPKVKLAHVSQVHEKLYQDAVKLREFRDSLQNLSTTVDPPSVEESLQLFKNELLTVHSINQRRKKPKVSTLNGTKFI